MSLVLAPQANISEMSENKEPSAQINRPHCAAGLLRLQELIKKGQNHLPAVYSASVKTKWSLLFFSPAFFSAFGAEWFFFSVAYGLHPVFKYAERNQVGFCRTCPAVTKSEVVFAGAPFVTVSFNYDMCFCI